jgi:hypothetical protein
MVAARNSWALIYDNLSDLRPWFSDNLCRLATGSGFGIRSLYTDDDEVIFAARRPSILNGIADIVARPDLLDRSLLLSLPIIGDDKRRDERALLSEFVQVRPGIFGALLDAVSTALRNHDHVHLSSLPRLADFATWVVAAEPALPWEAGGFLTAYKTNRASAHEQALDASLLTVPLQAVAPWSGTALELLNILGTRVDDATRKSKAWPRTPRGLSGALRRLGPSLRAGGLEITFEREAGGNRRRVIRIEEAPEKEGATPSQPSPASRSLENPANEGFFRDGSDEEAPTVPSTVPPVSARTSEGWDGRDDRDAQSRAFSGGAGVPPSPLYLGDEGDERQL